MLGSLKYKLSRLLTRRPNAILNSKIHKKARVGNGTQIVNSSIGKYSYAYSCKIAYTDIGAFCSIAPDCSIGGGSHPTNWVSSSPVFYKGKNVFKKNFSNTEYKEFKRTTIENDVWIGAKCLIKGGVTIGTGAIVGMGSVVTRDIPPYEIWAGNPAKKIRDRFPKEISDKLLESHWWEWDDSKISESAKDFSSFEDFIQNSK